MSDIFKPIREVLIDEGIGGYSESGDPEVIDRQAVLGYLEELSEAVDSAIGSATATNILPDLESYMQFGIEAKKSYTLAELEAFCKDEQVMPEYKRMKNRLENKIKNRIMFFVIRGDMKSSSAKIILDNIYGFAENVRSQSSVVVKTDGREAPEYDRGRSSERKGNAITFNNDNKSAMRRLESQTQKYIAKEVEVIDVEGE